MFKFFGGRKFHFPKYKKSLSLKKAPFPETQEKLFLRKYKKM